MKTVEPADSLFLVFAPKGIQSIKELLETAKQVSTMGIRIDDDFEYKLELLVDIAKRTVAEEKKHMSKYGHVRLYDDGDVMVEE